MTHYAVLVLFISSIGWGLTWFPIKALNDMGLDSMLLIFTAFASGAVLLLPWLLRQRHAWQAHLGLMLGIALAGGIANGAFQTAIFHGDVIRVMILFYLLPVWSVLGGWMFLGEKIDRIRFIAIVLCLGGASLILDVWHTSWQGISWIDVLAVCSGMGLAATNILFRLTPHIPVMSKVFSMFLGCTLLIGASLAIFSIQPGQAEPAAIPLAVGYGALWLTAITIGTQWAVTRMEAGRSAIIIVTELVVAVVTAALLTAAELKLPEMVGGLMVLSAAIMEGARAEEPGFSPAAID
jgi:drug/metabolite transporter (DMT)-like permease